MITVDEQKQVFSSLHRGAKILSH